MRRRSIFPDRPLTAMEIGLILAVVVIIVLCCCGFTLLGVFVHPAPAPVYTPIPTPSY